MAFYGLNFGETSNKHPAMKTRGIDTRTHLYSRVTPGSKPGPGVPPPVEKPLQPTSHLATGQPLHMDPQAAGSARNRTSLSLAQPTSIGAAGRQQLQRPSSRASSSSSRASSASRQRSLPPFATEDDDPIRGYPSAAAAPKPRKHFTVSKEFQLPSAKTMSEVFSRIDFNGNGMLSLAELDKAVVELWPKFNNKPAIMRAYKACDANGTGFVSKPEFPLFMKFLMTFTNLWETFNKADVDGDRRLTLDELEEGAAMMGIAPQEAARIFREMDTNGGGFVLFDEFCQHIAQKEVDAARASVKQKAAVKKLRRAPLLELPTQTSTDKLFTRLDFNGNGMLSLAELDKAVMELWPKFNNKPAIMRAYKACDANGSGFISKREFPLFLQFLVLYQNLFDEFKFLDKDGDRRITKAEFVRFAPDTTLFGGSSKTEDDFSDEFDAIDTNRGGMVLFDEFCDSLALRLLRRFAASNGMRPGSSGSRPEQAAPLVCHFCGKLCNNIEEHVAQCRQRIEHIQASLPSFLVQPLSEMPTVSAPVSPAEISRYNAIAKQLAEQNNYRICPECGRRFPIHQFGGHFNTHKISYKRKMELIKAAKTAKPLKLSVPNLPEQHTGEELKKLKRRLVGRLDPARLSIFRRLLSTELNFGKTIHRNSFVKLLGKCSEKLPDDAVSAIFRGGAVTDIKEILDALDYRDPNHVELSGAGFDLLDTDREGSVEYKIFRTAVRAMGLPEETTLAYLLLFQRDLEKPLSRQEFVRIFSDCCVALSPTDIKTLLALRPVAEEYRAVVRVVTLGGVEKDVELTSAAPMRTDVQSLRRRLALHGMKDIQRLELLSSSP